MFFRKLVGMVYETSVFVLETCGCKIPKKNMQRLWLYCPLMSNSRKAVEATCCAEDGDARTIGELKDVLLDHLTLGTC